MYLLDYTKLKSAEEADLLVKLRSLNAPLFSHLASRLFFVVNKIDAVCPWSPQLVVVAIALELCWCLASRMVSV